MNHVYRVVWNASAGMFQVASELAHAGGKKKPRRSSVPRNPARSALTLAMTVVLGGLPLIAHADCVSGGTITSSQPEFSWTSGNCAVNSGVVISNFGNVTALSISGNVGTLTNYGTIAGSQFGLNNVGTVGWIENYGTIAGESAAAAGIHSSLGTSIGILTNNGLISAGSTGVYNDGSIGTLTNSGTIVGASGLGESGSYYAGIVNAGTITELDNEGTGQITGGDFGIRNTGAIGTLANSGTILVTIGTVSGTAADVYNSGNIGTLTNSGQLLAGVADISVYGVYNTGTIGTLINSGTISITSGNANLPVILNLGAIGTLNNSGTIVNTNGMGIQNYGVGTYTGSIGTLVNSGTIKGSNFGIENDGATISTLNNNGGLISGPMAVGIDNLEGSTITWLSNSGTISGQTAFINLRSTIGTLNNSGTIIASNGFGVINTDAGTVSPIGTLINSGTIIGKYAVFNRSAIGTLDNSGLISSSNGYAIYNSPTWVGADGTIGTLINSGTIAGSVDALNIAAGVVGPVTNTGVIEGNIANATANALTISGGTGTTIGTLTGYNNTVGTITNTRSNLVFASGNQLLNDDVMLGTSGSLIEQSGSLILTGAVSGGSTTINGGTLQIGNGGTAGSISDNISNSGTVAFNRSDNVTYAGTVSGSGTLIQQGPGTLTLTGANTYAGATTIGSGATLALSGSGGVAASSGVADSGTLDISGTSGASIQSLSGAGNVTLGGATLTITQASDTFGGVISGTGGLTLAGGTESLTNMNSYTGATTIDNGATLLLSSANDISMTNVVDDGSLLIEGTIAGLSGSGNVSISSAGLLLSGGGSFGGTLSGGGGLTISGGTQTLTGANTYTGATTINRNATLALSGAGSVAQSGGVTDNGVLDISNTTSGASITNLAGSGAVNVGSQTLTLTDASGTFGGTFSGSGGKLLLSGDTGSLILDGNSSAFKGTTEIASGLLEVGDIDTPAAVLGGDVQVDSAGTLRGHGTVTGNVTNGGTVMPGGSVGTLTVGGSYTQASNATLSIEVSPTAASQLNVSGNATLGGTLAITYDPGTYSAKTYTLVSASSVNGTFSTTTSSGTSNLGGLTPSLGYTGTAVDLTLSGANDPVVIAPQDTSIYTAVGTSAILGAQAQGAALLDQMQHASTATAATPNGWVTATGNLTKVNGTNGEPAFQANRYGFLAGLEQKMGDYTVGVAAGYDHTDIDESGTGDSGTTDTLRAALYGSRFVGPVNLAATAGLGLDFLSQKRPFGSEGTAEGDHMGQEANLGGQASLPMTFGDVTVTPRLGMRYAYFHANGFGESGAGGEDLTVGADNVHSLQPYVGVTLDKAFGDATRPTTVQVRVSYARELLDANRALSVTAQDGTVFTAPGTNLPRGYLTTGASITLHPTKQMDVSLNYDTVINTGHASVQQGSVRVGYQF